MYGLLDANVTVAYYLASSMKSAKAAKVVERIRNIVDSVRTTSCTSPTSASRRGFASEPLRLTWMSSSRAAFRRLSLVEAVE